MKFDYKKTNMVKCIAIILMLWHHLFGCATELCKLYGVESKLFNWEFIYSFGLTSKICVGIYVFLTGYGITCSYKKIFPNEAFVSKSNLEKFSINRYIKLIMNFIYVYVVALLTSFFRERSIFDIYGVHGWKKGIAYAIFDILGLTNYFNTPSINETWWYMSIAVFIIFISPMMIKIYIQFGKSVVGVGILLFYLGVNNNSFVQYAFCLIMGIACAEENLLERIYNIKICKANIMNSFLKLLILSGTFCILVLLRNDFLGAGYEYWIDAIVPIVCCEFCMELSTLIPVLETIMNYIGKHSMNMFLIHTLIFEYYFTDFIYGFKNWFLILIALLITSLIGSIIIEKTKKLFNYQKLIDYCCIR